MSARELTVLVLLTAALLVVATSAVGLIVAPDALSRLHFVTPVTSLAGPLLAVAVAVDDGWTLPSGLVLLTVGLLAVSSPVLSAAVARVIADDPQTPPGQERP